MDQPRLSLAREWLRKARHDLDSARKLAADPDPLLDTAIYHCQQAAEKSIKGLLVLQDQRFEKTHDLRLLVTRAAVMAASSRSVYSIIHSKSKYSIISSDRHTSSHPPAFSGSWSMSTAVRSNDVTLTVPPAWY